MSIYRKTSSITRPLSIITVAGIFMILCLSHTSVLADDQNDAYRTSILALIAAHNVAYPPSLIPGGPGTVAGGVTYTTNLALKFIPPYLDQPNDIGFNPNYLVNGDFCGRQLNIARNQASYSNFLGVNPQLSSGASDWGAIGAPYLEHANTDATLKVFKSGELLGTGNQVFGIGTHTLTWEAETLISYPLDVALPVVLMYLTSLKELPAGKEFILNVMLEAGLISLDQFVIDSTPHELFPIVNRQQQRLFVYDRDAPQIFFSQDTVRVEALSPGGSNGDLALDALQPTVSTFDRCDQPVSLFANLPNFLPLGTHTVTWTALDAGPNPDSPRGDQRNETIRTQTIIIEDTTPPLLIPPADIVVESAGTASINLGQPLVFDVVDLEPAVTCEANGNSVDCLASFSAPVGVTEITWTATDSSGQAAQAMQLVNVKIPGSNNTPVAHDQTLTNPVKSFDSIDIELTAEDMDGDRLAFALVDQPQNGFFIAPLYPYFIEDYRIEAGPSPLTLEQRCDELFDDPQDNYDLDYPYFSEWVSVTDDGRSYVYDRGYVRCQQYYNGDGLPELELRIAVFDEQGALINAQSFGSDVEANDVWVNPNTGLVYMVYGTIDTTNSILRYSENLDFEFLYNMDNADGPGFNQDFVEEIQSVVVDPNGLLYAATPFNISVYKIEGVPPESNGTTIHPEYLGSLSNPGFNFGYNSLAIGPDGNVFASDSDGDRIYRYAASVLDVDGSFTPGAFEGWLGKCTTDNNPGLETHCDVANQRSVGFACTDQTCGGSGFGTEPGQFRNPKGIDIDPNGVLYVTDFDNNRVQRFTPEGYVAGIAKSNCSSNCFVLGNFGKPSDISVNSDRFYILDIQTQLLHVSETTPIKEIRDTSVVVEYSSNNNFIGTDTFTFEVTDGLRQDGVFVTSNLATVTVPVIRNDRQPIADAGIAATTDEDLPVAITLDGNDPDFPLDTIEFQISTPPQFGTLSGQGATRTYTPNVNYAGSDSFSFVLFDGTNTSAPESVAITIVPTNDPVVINPDSMNLFGVGYIGTIVVPFTDPDEQDLHRVSIDWGDGSAIELEGAPQSDGSLSGPLLQEGRGDSGVVVAEYLYTDEGTYPIEVCITDRIELDPNGVKTDTADSTTTCSTADINVEQRPLVLVDIEPSNCTVDPADEVAVPVCTAVDGNNIDYTLSVRNIMPDVAGGLTANNLVLIADVDPTLTITGAEAVAARALPGFGDRLGSSGNRSESGSVINSESQCSWELNTVTCTVDNLPSGSEVVIVLNTASTGEAVSDRNVRITTELVMDEANLAAVSKNARDVFVTLNPFGDADGDGVTNEDDAFPSDPNESVDTDGDGIGNVADLDDDADLMPDAWENRYGLNALSDDGEADSDGDGLTNVQEFFAGADPNRADSDLDGFLDGSDNCPVRFDRNQHDSNLDGRGDVCDVRMTARALATISPAGGNADDYAVLRSSDSGSRLWIGSNNGVWQHVVEVLTPDLTALDMAVVTDVDGTGSSAIAILAEDSFGSSRVTLTDSVSGTVLNELSFFDPNWVTYAVTELAGAAANGASALAVVAKHFDGTLSVEIRNAADGALFDTVNVLGVGWQPLDISALANGTLAILAAHYDGRIKVVSSSASGVLSETDFLDTSARALSLATVDMGESGAARYAVLAADAVDGALLEVRDAHTGALMGETLIAGSVPVDLVALSDTSNLALLLAAPETGALRVAELDGVANAVSPERNFLDGSFAPRAVVDGDSSEVGVLGSDEFGQLTLVLKDITTGDNAGEISTGVGSNNALMRFEDETFSLASGLVEACDQDGGCSAGDFSFAYNSTRENPIVLFQRSPVQIAFLESTPVEIVDYAMAQSLNYTSSLIGSAFDINDTVVLQLPNGDLYKIGNPLCLLNAQSECTETDSEVRFDWARLYPDSDFDQVSDDVDNCVTVANTNQLDADGDGFGNACDGDFNNDCVVNFVDVGAMTNVFFCSDDSLECRNADMDGSGAVNFVDYSMLVSEFLEAPGPSARQDLCSLPLAVNQPLTLLGTFSYDMDSADSGTPGNPEMDVFFKRITSTSGELSPINGASLALMGSERPSPDDCLAASMTVEGTAQSSMQLNDWFCMRTNGGRLSRFQITDASSLPINTAQNMEIDLTTWECDSCETSFDPTPLPGIVGWFDADLEGSIELAGDTVLNWQDRSGTIPSMASLNSNQRPTYTANGINGRGSVSFDGVDDRLFASTTTNLQNGYTIFIAARNDVRQNYNGLFSLRNTANGQQAALEIYWQQGTTDAASGNLVVAANRSTGSFAYYESSNAGPVIGNSYTMAARVSADFTTRQLQVDGVNVPQQSFSSDVTPNAVRQMCLGQGFGIGVSNTILEGQIGEVLVFDRDLTDAEFDFVSTYIESKWAQN